MRLRARTVVGLAALASTAVAGSLINDRLKSITGTFDLGDQPSRTSIVFRLDPDQVLHYRLGTARVLRMIVNANLPADDLVEVRGKGRPLWFELKVDVEDSKGVVIHRQDLNLRLDPTPGVLDPVGRYYLDHVLVPAAGKVRALDLSTLKAPERLNLRMGDTDPSITDLSVRIFTITRTAERELAYLWTRMSGERRETLARSNLYGPRLMTEDERMNQLRHRWFPLPPEGGDSGHQRKLYTRIDDQSEELTSGYTPSFSARTSGKSQASLPPELSPDNIRRTFAYVLPPGEPFVQAIHHVDSNPTPVRLDLRRILPPDDGKSTTAVLWRLLGPDGKEISTGRLEPQDQPAEAEAIDLQGRKTGEPLRSYFMVSEQASRFELTALGSPVLFTLAVAHPLRPLRIPADEGPTGAEWFLMRTSDHRQRIADGRAVAIWKGPRAPDLDAIEYSWERIEPDEIITWRSLGEPAEDEAPVDATNQRLAFEFDSPEVTFRLNPAPGQERLLLLRWHAPTGSGDALEIEVDIAGVVPADQPLSRWTSLKRHITLEPGEGEFPVLGTDQSVRSPQRSFLRLGPDLNQEPLTVMVRSSAPTGYLSASIGAPAAKEWRTLVETPPNSTENGVSSPEQDR